MKNATLAGLIGTVIMVYLSLFGRFMGLLFQSGLSVPDIVDKISEMNAWLYPVAWILLAYFFYNLYTKQK